MSGIEPPAQPNLNHTDIDPHLGEPEKRDRRQQFEFGRLAVASLAFGD